ncbi:MAG: SRPBCC domain-containing protein [Armatimonadetes bacterium]|nr:SRPBCC domain-containing protein [Armatimonadota bacterium]
MATARTDVVHKEIRIAASPEIVFAFFTDPAKMIRWKGQQATLDPQPGGIYRVDINGRYIARGAYVEIVPYSRVVFTWGWEGEGQAVPPGSTTVEVSLIPDGDGTIVRLVHRDLPTAQEREAFAKGWTHYLARLQKAAAGLDPGPDPNTMPDATHES